jgi:hypothetical protein
VADVGFKGHGRIDTIRLLINPEAEFLYRHKAP